MWLVSSRLPPKADLALLYSIPSARGSQGSHLRNARELHVYRGLERGVDGGFIMGHEFTGTVVSIGEGVQTVTVGDRVVAPFTVSWYVWPPEDENTGGWCR